MLLMNFFSFLHCRGNGMFHLISKVSSNHRTFTTTLVRGMFSSIRWKGWPLYDRSILKNIWLHFGFNYHQLHIQSINYSVFLSVLCVAG